MSTPHYKLLKIGVVAAGCNVDYNQDMKLEMLHGWQVSIPEAMEIQRGLAQRVSRTNEVSSPRFIAGVDTSVDRLRKTGTAAVVVLNYPELKLVEVKTVRGELAFPYVPGLLSFREAPLTLSACQQLNQTPDLFIVDGQGIAHPRRLGLASHLGLFLNTPTIGCAKSLLLGNYGNICEEPGSYAEIASDGEIIGAALRTKKGVKPVFVSIGNKIDLSSAIFWTMSCCLGYRLPEPSRLAHLASVGKLMKESSVS